MSLEVKTERKYAEWRGCSVRTIQRERSFAPKLSPYSVPIS
jgi:hypothetical protein